MIFVPLGMALVVLTCSSFVVSSVIPYCNLFALNYI